MIQCTICLSALNIKEDIVHTTSCGHIFHRPCLDNALKMSRSCPQCRRSNIQHFQVFLTEADEEESGAVGMSKEIEFLSEKMNQISKQLENMSVSNLRTPGRSESVRNQNHSLLAENSRSADQISAMQLQRDNQNLREILEMEKILSTNTEREIDQLKLEVRERNDLINALQGENDDLRDELILYGIPRRRLSTTNLVDL